MADPDITVQPRDTSINRIARSGISSRPPANMIEQILKKRRIGLLRRLPKIKIETNDARYAR